MSDALERYFSVFKEGANDSLFRKRAMEVQEKIEQALSSVDVSLFKTFPGSKAPSFYLNVGDLLKSKTYKQLYLTFKARDETKKSGTRATFSPPQGESGSQITFFVDLPKKVFDDLDGPSFVKMMTKNQNVKKFFERSRQFFWHEFVHFMDYRRIDPKNRKAVTGATHSASVAHGGTAAQYLNNPLEYNAFLQQGLANVEHHLKNVETFEDAKILIGEDPSEFYRRVIRLLDNIFSGKNATRHLTDETKAKIKKRVAQMWNDVKMRFDRKEAGR